MVLYHTLSNTQI